MYFFRSEGQKFTQKKEELVIASLPEVYFRQIICFVFLINCSFFDLRTIPGFYLLTSALSIIWQSPAYKIPILVKPKK